MGKAESAATEQAALERALEDSASFRQRLASGALTRPAHEWVKRHDINVTVGRSRASILSSFRKKG